MAAIQTSFAHAINYKGNVVISRGDDQVTVTFDELEKLIAEKIRYDSIERLQKMDTKQLLMVRKIA